MFRGVCVQYIEHTLSFMLVMCDSYIYCLIEQQKRSWQIWSGLYNITVEILRALTIKLRWARARARARTRDRPRLRARAMVSSRARARAWECVYV